MAKRTTEWHGDICDPESRKPGGYHEPGLCVGPVQEPPGEGATKVAVWTEQEQDPQAPVKVVFEWGRETWRGSIDEARQGIAWVGRTIDSIPHQRLAGPI